MTALRNRILVISDSPGYYSTVDLKRLYPRWVDEHDLHRGPITAERLAPYDRVWTLIRRAENMDKLDYRLIREHARQGAQVVSHLYEYARGSGFDFRFRNAGATRHKLLLVAESDPITRGFALGDEVYWYRNSNDLDEPPMGHYTYREVLCDSDPSLGRKVLARSTLTGGAVWVEERFPGGGALLAYDLLSPLNLVLAQGDPWLLDRGAFAKYLPAGNLLGGTVRYGRYQNQRLTVEEVLAQVRAFTDLSRPSVPVEVRDEGPTSEGTPFLTVRFGNERGPRFLLLAGKHGMEWENVAGLLITIEQLLTHEHLDLERFCVVAAPLANPFGYRNNCRHNASGVDLNRQLRRDWDQFRGWADEVVEPWTFDYKGAAQAGEPEARIEARLREEPNLVAFIDAHGLAGAPILGGSGPDAGVIQYACEQVVENMRNRYLVRYLDQPASQQFTLSSYPGQRGGRGEEFGAGPYYSIWYENTCQLPDVHATVMQTDFAVEMNLTLMKTIAEDIETRAVTVCQRPEAAQDERMEGADAAAETPEEQWTAAGVTPE